MGNLREAIAKETREKEERKKKEAEKQEAGVCPVCKSRELEFMAGPFEPEDDEMHVFYEWTCLKCESRGEEWYSLTFTEHGITKNGTVPK